MAGMNEVLRNSIHITGKRNIEVPGIDDKGISSPEIQSILPILNHAVAELSTDIKKGRYVMLLGNDTAPTSILQGVINHVNKEHDRSDIPTIYIDDKGDLSASDIIRISSAKQKFTGPRKALLVVDRLEDGEDVRRIGDILHTPVQVKAYAGYDDVDSLITYDIVSLGEAGVGGEQTANVYHARGVLRGQVYPTERYPEVGLHIPVTDWFKELANLEKRQPSIRDFWGISSEDIQKATEILVNANFLSKRNGS